MLVGECDTVVKVLLCSGIRHVKSFAPVASSLFGEGCSSTAAVDSGDLNDFFGSGSSQVVVFEASATLSSLPASSAAPLDFCSTSGVLGGAAFGAPIISA